MNAASGSSGPLPAQRWLSGAPGRRQPGSCGRRIDNRSKVFVASGRRAVGDRATTPSEMQIVGHQENDEADEGGQPDH
jgi:hypothetical protein